MRLGILISGGGRTLLNLHKHIESGDLKASLGVVISSSSKCKGVERAQGIGVPVEVIRKKKDLSDEVYSQKIRTILKEHQVDFVVLAGFLKKFLPGQEFANRCINIHPALIPSFCGPGFYGDKVHEAVWRRGCRVSGCTVHFVNEEYDAGPILLQEAVSLLESDEPDDIARKVFDAECSALPRAIQSLIDKEFKISNGRVVFSDRSDQ